MLFMPNLVFHYAFAYEMPHTPLDYFGVFVGIKSKTPRYAGRGR